ncbi:calcium homeostasis endoplasmic reticulum protein isoform X2 [Hermetia illucens]|uniref:calcium homeostasis endoplasmic reticulum protein isoform X2 n=1 Tax=Hermetia illucens TaxID=343691 RepID=UPI0018CC14B2|nr:calcium homeostasis endoplasmic reticulum protein isoform X2 [Hermetia illucens]XP_037904620.1 calcium homeostasis endoplasmic reticulum protein isoform X2 [Hermetia illucens]
MVPNSKPSQRQNKKETPSSNSCTEANITITISTEWRPSKPAQQQQQPQSQPLHNPTGVQQLMSASANPGSSQMGGYHQQNMAMNSQQQQQQPPQQQLWHGGSNNTPTTNSIQSQIDAITMQQSALREQIRQSEHNLSAQHGVLLQQQQKQIDEAINKAQNDVIHKQAEDYNVYLAEFDEILQPIIDACTKDSISTGKNWILQHTSDTAKCNVVLQYLLKKALVSGASFTQKLHLIYLVNDVLHHCVRKNANDLKACLENVVIPMFCSAEMIANDDQKAKLCKLLSLWESKAKFFDACVISKLRSPESSMQEYKTNLMNIHNNVISTYTQATKAALESYQQQHQIFIQHAAQQISVLEQQKQTLEQQAIAQVQESYSMPNANLIPPLIDPQQLKSPNLNPSGLLGNIQPSSNQLNSSMQMSNSNQSAPPAPPPLMSQKIPVPPELQASYGSPGSGGSMNSQSNNSQMSYNNITNGSNNSTTQYPSQLPASHPYAQLFANTASNNSNSRFGSPPPAPSFQIPDLSKPPPGFSQGQGQQQQQQQPATVSEEDTKPTVPYYELPAGLMVPLIRLEDYKYKPLDPNEVRLPPPAPQSERLSSAIVAFYSLPSHDRPRDVDGWEKLGLYEYYKVKNAARKQKEEEIQKGQREKSRSPSPIQIELVKPKKTNKRCYRSKSRSRSRSKSRSVSPPARVRSPLSERSRNSGRYSNSRRSPKRSPARDRERERDRDRGDRSDRERDRPRDRDRSDRDRDRSVSPPSFFGGNYPKSNEFIEETNKGHQMLMKMGWAGSGTGLGSKGQGIDSPISGGEVRDRKDMYKGVGINLNDPYENFRKNKGAAFIHRMRSRAEEKS